MGLINEAAVKRLVGEFRLRVSQEYIDWLEAQVRHTVRSSMCSAAGTGRATMLRKHGVNSASFTRDQVAKHWAEKKTRALAEAAQRDAKNGKTKKTNRRKATTKKKEEE